MRYSVLTLLILFFYSLSFGQIRISGKIITKDNTSLQGASIVVTNGDIILTYAISDTNGSYDLNIHSELDSLQINVSYIGYGKQTKKVLNENQTLNFTLLASSEKLKEVIVKSSPIIKRGDTLNYYVHDFIGQKDRVIADVLRKLPGIEILADGKILYQGKPIQKYYIGDLDLLEGKYNLANNNLPASAVSKVQVLENHQPLKVLDSLVFSDKASLNITLKKNITVTGTSKLGIGLSPFLWDVNITPMLFAKKQQMITSYQTNNVGNDISKEIKILTIEDLLDQFESNNQKKDWVTIQELSPPPFSKKRWLDNNAHLLTTNYLVRLKKDLDLKVNLSYINDFQLQNGSTQTTFFRPTDTINIIENTNNKLFFKSLKSKFILTKNTNKNYLKNTFEINNYWDTQNGKIVLNNEKINQSTDIPYASINNNLKIIKPFGKKLVTIKSVLSYSKLPQNLSLTPGQFENLLNNSNSLEKLNQKIEHSNFYANNAFSFTKKIKKFTFTPQLGFIVQNQQLDSHISIFENGIQNILPNEFQNNLLFSKNAFYNILATQYHNNNWNIELETPFKLQTFKRTDKNLSKKQNLNKWTFEPRLSIKKDLNAFWKTTFSASLKNNFSDINQLYYGYTIHNYRNIQKYETPILESSRKNITLGISYRNPIKSLFIRCFYAYDDATQNLLLGNSIDNNGTISFGFFERDNNSNTHNINLRASKYFSKLKTTFTLTANTLLDNKEQLLNEIITDITTKTIQVKGKLDTEITEWMSIEYENKISISNTQFENQQSFDNILAQEHLVNFNFYPSSNQYIGFDFEYYKNNLSNQNLDNYFLNLNYRYTFKESKIDIEFNWNNILNTKELTTVFNDAFSYIQSTYRLRPRQVLMSIKFNF